MIFNEGKVGLKPTSLIMMFAVQPPIREIAYVQSSWYVLSMHATRAIEDIPVSIM